jgi:hypothetical protein
MSCPNVKECFCPNVDCANHAHCCVCVKNHRDKGNLPICLRPKADAPTEKK